jgi:hypothetical protein
VIEPLERFLDLLNAGAAMDAWYGKVDLMEPVAKGSGGALEFLR